MTDEAILQAEKELKVSKSPPGAPATPTAPPKINRTAATVSPAAAAVPSADTKKEEAAAAGNKENAGDTANTTATSPVKIVSKPSAEDMEEKIKSRAERFGGFQSDDAKKLARAAKFGTGATNGAGSTKIGGAPAADLDTLKKRAERFGTNSSNSLKKMEVDEAIKRRQERFGVVDKNEPKVRLTKKFCSTIINTFISAKEDYIKHWSKFRRYG